MAYALKSGQGGRCLADSVLTSAVVHSSERLPRLVLAEHGAQGAVAVAG